MAKEPTQVNLEIGEWLLLTTLVSESPKDFQKEEQFGSDIYDLEMMTTGCAKLVFEESPTQREYCVSVVSKFKKYMEAGFTTMEFKPFDDQDTKES